MYLSVFEIFKIGIGPSSSHTMGPMIAAGRFLDLLRDRHEPVARIRASLRGSLAFTGKGHATDRAVLLGLLGYRPADIDMVAAEAALARLHATRVLPVNGLGDLPFTPAGDVVFDYETLEEGHPNQLRFEAFGPDGAVLVAGTWFSVGGGFVQTRRELEAASHAVPVETGVPHPFGNAADLLGIARRTGRDIAGIMRANECALRPEAEVDAALAGIWRAMSACMARGLGEGAALLPGGLGISRRAAPLHRRLQEDRGGNRQLLHTAIDWLSAYAMAVNEENAAGGQVVTAPTNGAAGVVPAVLRYYLDHCTGSSPAHVGDFLLTAGAIGGLIKLNASISGAEAGCQGEVGTASAMAAAGLCAVLGGTPAQVENAAEIALEHHLGMTCDPVAGLVQVPCIERNAFGAVKAVAAASLALRGDGNHFMPLDNCIEAMRQTGLEMNSKYKETALGGLAVNVPNC
ncbi:MAG: L-serine ammonia-lyase [Pseudomonadota bacterium]|nr:L-serine ammonia-lyase [Pseudomonadota bacterium]